MSKAANSISISGAGLVTPLGLDRHATWAAVCEGRSGIAPLTRLEQPPLPGKQGGEAPRLPEEPDEPTDERGSRRAIRYLRRAMADAMREAGVAERLPYEPQRCGIMLGTTLHGMPAAGRFFRENDPQALADFLAGAVLGQAAGEMPFAGFRATTCSACSSGLGSIALAMTLLRSGELDLVVAGGYDPISEYAYAGFNSLRLVAETPIRPFCRGREGMKVSEGYGLVVLERTGDAQTRGVSPLAEVRGSGESADVHHLTQPDPSGDGAARAIRGALEAAGLKPSDIGLISAHATGTPDNDGGEAMALRQVFAEGLRDVPLVAFKSHLGHTLGGAGAVELILAAMAMREGVVPPTAHVTPEELEFADIAVQCGAEAKPAGIGATLNLSLGFGGANTAMILTPPERVDSVAGPSVCVPSSRQDVVITGVGTVMGDAIGGEAFVERLERETPVDLATVRGVDGRALAELIQARRVRRMSGYVRLSLAATGLAMRDAAVEDVAAFGAEAAGILGTVHGSTAYSTQCYQQLVEEGLAAANPMLFAEGVPNAGAAHLSMTFNVKGACQTIIGGRTAGLDAVRLAAARIRSGVWRRAIISAAEEDTPLLGRIYHHCGLAANDAGGEGGAAGPFDRGGFVPGSGSVTLILESAEAAAERGATPRGRVDATASAWGQADDGKGMVRRVHEVLHRVGDGEAVVTTANGSDLTRAEATALQRREDGRPRRVGGIYGHTSELFSVMGLAGVAAVLLRGRLPRLLGPAAGADPEVAADGTVEEKAATVIAMDRGGVTGVRIGL